MGTVVDTTYIEECEETFTTECTETHQQVHHSSAVVGHDSQVISHGIVGAYHKRSAEPSEGYGYGSQCQQHVERQCHKVPQQHERKVPRPVCNKVPRQQCHPTAHKVARKVCESYGHGHGHGGHGHGLVTMESNSIIAHSLYLIYCLTQNYRLLNKRFSVF